jgi:hypothetical protein
MRSSKQRQRNKQNRQNRPSGGNIINRVFDSSGPEGKVRGTPQQIIEKYLQLHRDAQLAGDRVNAENFAQHAEHYTRILAEAQRDVERAREEQEQFQRDRQQERERQFEQSRDQREHREIRDRDFNRDRPRFRPAEDTPVPAAEPSFLTQPLFPVLVAAPQDDAVPEPALVETPEERVQSRRERPRRDDFERRRDRGPRPEERPAEPVEAPADVTSQVEDAGPAAAEPVAEAPVKAERPRRPRKPRAPKADEAPAATPDAAE